MLKSSNVMSLCSFLTFFGLSVSHILWLECTIHSIFTFFRGLLETYTTLLDFFTYLQVMLVICRSCFLLAAVNPRKPKGGSQNIYFEQKIKSMGLFGMG
jgi:hypothetical protein